MEKIKLVEVNRRYDLYEHNPYVIYDIMLGDEKIGDVEIVEAMSEDDLEEVDLKPYEEDTALNWIHCDGIFISENYRNHGYGTQALELLTNIYNKYTITPNNEDAARLYARLGNENVSYQDALYTDQGYGVYEIS